MISQVQYRWYVYQLKDPRNGSVFYVGKGKDGRMKQHEAEARRGVCSKKTNRIREIWSCSLEVDKEQVAFFSDEQMAYDYETDLIEQIGLENLTNVLPGGQKAWLNRVVKRREARQRKERPTKVDLDNLVSRIAWIAHKTNGFRNEIRIDPEGSGLREAMERMIVRQHGGHSAFAKKLIDLAVEVFGPDKVRDQFRLYNVDMRFA